jgi:hypothetical protein
METEKLPADASELLKVLAKSVQDVGHYVDTSPATRVSVPRIDECDSVQDISSSAAPQALSSLPDAESSGSRASDQER